MRRAVLLAPALILGLASCGSDRFETVSDLARALDEAGISCPEFTQVAPSGESAGHGSCAERGGETTVGLDVYENESDRDATVKATADTLQAAGIGYCIVYADLWSVTNSGAAPGDCELIRTGMDGELVEG